MKKVFGILAWILSTLFAMGQDCEVKISATKQQIKCSEEVHLSAKVLGGESITLANFESPGLNGSVFNGQMVTNNTEPPEEGDCNNPTPNGNGFLWFADGEDSEDRYYESESMDLSGFNTLSFWFRFGASNFAFGDCDMPEKLTEGVFVQFWDPQSASWTSVRYLEPPVVQHTLLEWTEIIVLIPDSLAVDGGKIRWYQMEYSHMQGFGALDHWGIDEISLSGSSGWEFQWPEISGNWSEDNNNQSVQPFDSQVYTVKVRKGNLQCEDQLEISVLRPEIAEISSDMEICPYDETLLYAKSKKHPTSTFPNEFCFPIERGVDMLMDHDQRGEHSFYSAIGSGLLDSAHENIFIGQTKGRMRWEVPASYMAFDEKIRKGSVIYGISLLVDVVLNNSILLPNIHNVTLKASCAGSESEEILVCERDSLRVSEFYFVEEEQECWYTPPDAHFLNFGFSRPLVYDGSSSVVFELCYDNVGDTVNINLFGNEAGGFVAQTIEDSLTGPHCTSSFDTTSYNGLHTFFQVKNNFPTNYRAIWEGKKNGQENWTQESSWFYTEESFGAESDYPMNYRFILKDRDVEQCADTGYVTVELKDSFGVTKPRIMGDSWYCDGDTLDLYIEMEGELQPHVQTSFFDPQGGLIDSLNYSVGGVAIADAGIYNFTLSTELCSESVVRTVRVTEPVSGPLADQDYSLFLFDPPLELVPNGQSYLWYNDSLSYLGNTIWHDPLDPGQFLYHVSQTVSKIVYPSDYFLDDDCERIYYTLGCDRPLADVLVNVECKIPDLSFTSEKFYCGFGATIQLEAENFSPPIQYIMNGDTSTSGEFSGVPFGPSMVYINSPCGIIDSLEIEPLIDSIEILDIQKFPQTCISLGGFNLDLCEAGEPYTFFLNGIETPGPVFDSLNYGLYEIRIEDVHGNSLDTNVLVNYSNNISSLITNNESCEGAEDGFIVVNMLCFDPEVSFQLNGEVPSANYEFYGLSGGTYDLVVFGPIGDTLFHQEIELHANPIPSVEEFSIANNTCKGLRTGGIYFNSPQNELYSINGGETYFSGPSFENLEAGTYFLRIKTSEACVSNSVEVQISNLFEVQITELNELVPPSCPDSHDGTVHVSASGGFEGFSYIYGATVSTNDTLFGLPGNEAVSVIAVDEKGCISEPSEINLSYSGKLSLEIDTIFPASCNDNNGQVFLDFVSDDTNAEMNIDGAGFVPFQNHISNLTGGTHTVIVRNANGCFSELVTINIPQTGKLKAPSIISRPANCEAPHSPFGAVVVIPDSSDGDSFEISFDERPYQQRNDTSGLAESDLVKVMVKRPAVGTLSECYSDPILVEIGGYEALDTNNVSLGSPTCVSNNQVMIEVNPKGGGGNYSFSFDGGNEQQENTWLAQVNENTYDLDLRIFSTDVCALDNSRIFRDFEVQIPAYSPVLISQISQGPVSCFNGSDGVINIQVSGDGTNNEYSIDGGSSWSSSSEFTGLSSGLYSVQVKSHDDCLSEPITILLENPEIFHIEDIITEPIRCYGDSNGSIEVLVNGGSQEYEVSIDGGAQFQNSPLFLEIAPGEYHIKVRDRNGCGADSSFALVLDKEPVSVFAKTKHPNTCFPGDEGEIIFSALGGVPPYVIKDEDGNIYNGNTISGLIGGAYRFFVTDNLGCKSEITEFVLDSITIRDGLDWEIIDSISCFGATDGRVLISSAFSETEYSTDDGNSWNTQALFAQIGSGTFPVLAKALGCEVEIAIPFAEPEKVDLHLLQSGEILCADDSIELIATGLNGTAPYQFSINNGLSFLDTNTFEIGIGDYTYQARDAHGCESDIRTISIDGPLPLSTQVLITPVNQGNDGEIQVQTQGGTPPYEFSLSPNFGFQSSSYFFDLAKGEYILTVRDAHGCEEYYNVTMEVMNSLSEVLPEHSLVIFPNPTTGLLKVNSSRPIAKLVVYNPLGQFVATELGESINLVGKPRGIYLLQAWFNDHDFVERRIVLE